MAILRKDTALRTKRRTARREKGTLGAKVRRHKPSMRGSSEWIRFTLNEDIASDDTGLVTIVESMSSLEVSDIVTVLNGTPNTGLQNAVGEAVKANGGWVAILIDQPALFIAGIATTHSHNWTGNAGSPSTTMPSPVSPLGISGKTSLTNWPNGFDRNFPIENPYNLFWRSGTTLVLRYSTFSGGRYEVVHATPGTLRAKFQITDDVANELNPTISANIILPLSIGLPGQISGSVLDRYCLCHNAKPLDTGTVDYIISDNTWEVSECNHVATELMGQLTGSGFTGTPTDITVTQVYGLNGRSPNASMSNTMTIKNRFAWASGVSNGKIYFKWDAILGQYFAVQMTCPP